MCSACPGRTEMASATAEGPARRLDGAGGRRALLRLAPRRCRARVIKIERAEGDFARAYDAVAKGQLSYFVWLNRGKESLCLDIKAPDDKALLRDADRRGRTSSSRTSPPAPWRGPGFGSAALRAKHPRLITVDISGYGEEGEYASMKAYDLLVQAESGLAHVTGRAEGPAASASRPATSPAACTLRRGAGGADRARHHRARQGHRRSACSTAWRTG